MIINNIELDGNWHSTPTYSVRFAKNNEKIIAGIMRNQVNTKKYAAWFYYELGFLNEYLAKTSDNDFFATFIANDIEEVENEIDKFLIKMHKLAIFI